MSPEQTPPPQTYAARLGIHEPDLATLAADPQVSLRHLAMAVLLARSRPVAWDELVATIAALGSRGDGPRLHTSLTRSLAAATAFVHRPDGRLDVDLSSRDWSWFRIATDAQPGGGPPTAPPEPLPPLPDPDVPLTCAELEGTITDVAAAALSVTARLVAALDVAGPRVTPAQVEALWVTWTGKGRFLSESSLHYFTSPLVRRLPGPAFQYADAATLSPAARTTLRAARAAVRAALLASQTMRRADEHWKETERRWKTEGRQRIVDAQCARRALVHPFRHDGRVVAVTILDAAERTTTTLVGEEELGRLASFLGGYDVLVGLGLRDALVALERLNAQPARIVDLAATPRSRRIAGRVVKLTTADWLQGSLGRTAALDDPERLAQDLARGDRARFAARLERDAKTLFAFYRYGVIHRAVRLRRGSLDAQAPVDWCEPGDGSLREYLDDLEKGGGPIEVLFPPAPPFEARWERASVFRRGPAGIALDPSAPIPDRPRTLSLNDVLDARRT